jgi:hypothetical protein
MYDTSGGPRCAGCESDLLIDACKLFCKNPGNDILPEDFIKINDYIRENRPC